MLENKADQTSTQEKVELKEMNLLQASESDLTTFESKLSKMISLSTNFFRSL